MLTDSTAQDALFIHIPELKVVGFAGFALPLIEQRRRPLHRHSNSQAKRFDDMLRWLRDRFSFGSGRVVPRGAANIFGVTWRVPLSPRKDGFKTTAYSRQCGLRFYYLFRVLHAALQIELEATYMLARHAAQRAYEARLAAWERERAAGGTTRKRPREPDRDVGLRVEAAANIRDIGRTMLSPYAIVFGLGRYELRDRFLCAYSVLTQKFTVSAMVKIAEQRELLESMRAALSALLSLAMELRMLQSAAWGTHRKRGSIGARALSLHVKVLSAHRLWRWTPMVCRTLPDLLVPAILRVPHILGCPLANGRFREPSATRKDKRSYEQQRTDYVEQREARWQTGRWTQTIQALTDLSRWLRMESIHFQRRVLHWDAASADAVGPTDRLAGELRSELADALEDDQDENHSEAAILRALEREVCNVEESDPTSTASDSDQLPLDMLELASERTRALVCCGARAAGSTESQLAPESFQSAEVEHAASAGTRVWSLRPEQLVPVVRCRTQPTLRRRLWEAASECFHPTVLVKRLAEGGLPVRLRSALHVVFAFFAPLLFQTRPADVARYVNPPAELFTRLVFPEFEREYVTLRQETIPKLLSNAEVEEKCFTDTRNGDRRVVEEELYKALMVLPYTRVSTEGIWHVLRVYHRLIMAGGTTEALAESICSTLTMHVRACPGRLPAVGDVITAARLRSAGVSGSGRDSSFITRALDIYFRGKPWHVLVGRKSLQLRAREHPDFDRLVSPAVRRYREALCSGVRFTFLHTGLRALARGSGRTNISVIVDGGSGSVEARGELVRNPKAGLKLRHLSGAEDLISALRDMVESYEPVRLDPRMAELVPVPVPRPCGAGLQLEDRSGAHDLIPAPRRPAES